MITSEALDVIFCQKGLTDVCERGIIYFVDERCGSSSVVECHLAKVDVASPNLVYRSNKPAIEDRWFFLLHQYHLPPFPFDLLVLPWYTVFCMSMRFIAHSEPSWEMKL